MPIYEYECLKCGARTEAMQKVTDKPLTKCPKCKGRLEKLLSAPAIQFKGAGWYVTDYAGKKSGEEKSASSEKSEPAATEKASGAETKEKSAKKTAADKKSSTKSGATSGD